MAKILVLHGPNLNLLGSREPAYYGNLTLAQIDRIHEAKIEDVAAIIFNPAAFSHTSIALRDALLAVQIPFVEVHLSNIFNRESFRRNTYFSDIAVGCITGLGAQGYILALQFLFEYLERVDSSLELNTHRERVDGYS